MNIMAKLVEDKNKAVKECLEWLAEKPGKISHQADNENCKVGLSMLYPTWIVQSWNVNEDECKFIVE